MTTSEEFDKHVVSQLKIIDDILSKKEIDIKDRISMAAEIFIKYCVVSVNRKSPENYLAEKWFKHLIKPIRNWYQDKYGPLVWSEREKIFKGLVVFHGDFFELDIPLSILKPKGALRDLIFPKEILPFENEFDFIKCLPKLSKKSREKIFLQEEIRTVVNSTRSVNNNIRSAKFINKSCQELSDGIQVHIQKAVLDILSREKTKQLNSFWEIHLAIEKSMKVILCQAYGKFDHTHNLIELLGKVEEINPGLISRKELEEFPDSKKVIKFRYGTGPMMSKLEIYSNYKKALAILEIITEKFERELVLDNAVFTLGKLPWQD